MGVNYKELLGEQNIKDLSDPTKVKKTTSKSLIAREIGASYIPTAEEYTTGQSIRFGESQFDKGIENIELVQNISKIRAERQPWYDQATHAVAGGIMSGVLTTLEDISYIADIPNNVKAASAYLSQDHELGKVESNMFADQFKEWKETITQDWMPIYRKDPSKITDFGDSGFYWEALRGIIDSAVGFGGVGLAAGAAVKMTGRAMRMARLQNYNNALLKGVGQAGKALQQGNAGRLTTAYITNYGESKMMALELYEQTENKIFGEFIEQYTEANGKEPDAETLEQFEFDAKIEAGKQANNFMIANKMFMFTDYLALNRMFKGSSSASRNILKSPGAKEFWKSQASNAPKEALEEMGQVALQEEGLYRIREKLSEKYDIQNDKSLKDLNFMERFLEFATTEQALLEGAMGFLGGPLQYGITQAPFEKRGEAKKRYTDQQNLIKDTEEYLDTNILNLALNKAVVEGAKKEFTPENIDNLEEVVNTQSFVGIVSKNLANGTTERLEQGLVERMEQAESPEVRKGIQKRIDQMRELENSYNQNLKKYNDASTIMAVDNDLTTLNNLKDILNKEQIETDKVANNIIQNYNEVSGTNHSFLTVMNSLEDTSGVFQQFVAENLLPSIEKTKQLDAYKKEAASKIQELYSYQSELTDPYNNDIIDDFNTIEMDTSMATDKKVGILESLVREVKGKKLKKRLDNKVKNYKAQIEESKNNATVDSKGGLDKVQTDKANKDKKIKPVKPAATFTPSGDIDNVKNEDAATRAQELEARAYSNESVEEAIRKKIAREEEIGNAERSLEQAGLTEQQEKTEKAFNDTIDQPNVKKVDNLNPNYTPEDAARQQEGERMESVTSYDTTASQMFSNTVSKVDNPNAKNGIKLNHTAAKEFIESLTNKQGLPVQLKLQKNDNPAYASFMKGDPITDKMARDISIQAVISEADGTTHLTYLYNPKVSDVGKDTYKREIALRKKALTNIRNGKSANTFITYQYSGGFENSTDIDGNPVVSSLLDLAQFDDSADVKFMYINGKGEVIDVDTNEFSEDFPGTKLMFNGMPWSGSLMFKLTSPNNDKSYPVKANIRDLNNKEKTIINYIIDKALQKKPDGGNFLEDKMDQHKTILENLGEADKGYLGTTVSLGTILNHLIYENKPNEGEAASSTSLYVKNSKLYVGGQPYTRNQFLSDAGQIALDKFLTTYKKRNVNVNKLATDPAYKSLMLEHKIINTDIAIDKSGNVFKALDVDTSNENNRFLTQAIYISNEINGEEVTIEETQSVEENEIVQEIKAKLSALKDKTLTLTEDNSQYQDADGNTYDRVSSLKGQELPIDEAGMDRMAESTARGTIIDEMLRGFIDGAITSNEELQEMYTSLAEQNSAARPFTKEFISNLYSIFKEVKQSAPNLVLMADTTTLWGDINGQNIAGTIDLLAVDKNTGKVFIIDLKTSSRNRRSDYSGEDPYNYKESDSIQQSAYAELLRQRTGINVSNIALLPIQVSKNQSQQYSKANLNKDSNGRILLAAELNTDIYNVQKPLTNVTKLKQRGKFRKIPINFVEYLTDSKGEIKENVAMHVAKDKSLISIADGQMEKKFKEKAWTNPRLQSDDTRATPMPVNTFQTFEEFFTFALIHEWQHTQLPRRKGEKTGPYEDRINQAALQDLVANYDIDGSNVDLNYLNKASTASVSTQPTTQISTSTVVDKNIEYSIEGETITNTKTNRKLKKGSARYNEVMRLNDTKSLPNTEKDSNLQQLQEQSKKEVEDIKENTQADGTSDIDALIAQQNATIEDIDNVKGECP